MPSRRVGSHTKQGAARGICGERIDPLRNFAALAGVWFLLMADPSSSPGSAPSELLRRWERAAAMVIGTILAGVAIWALFTSSNQAGTAALLLVAAAFLLIGVQGTALVRFGSGSASVELDRRVAAAVQRADEVAERDPRLAQGILDGAAIIEPRVGPAAGAFRTMSYESAVRRALERVKPDGATVTVAPSPADLSVISPAGSVLVSIVYRQSRSIQQTDLAPLVASRQLEETVGGLFAANQPMTSSVVEYIATAAMQGTLIEAVTWKDPEDDRHLGEALNRLLKGPQRLQLPAR